MSDRNGRRGREREAKKREMCKTREKNMEKIRETRVESGAIVESMDRLIESSLAKDNQFFNVL